MPSFLGRGSIRCDGIVTCLKSWTLHFAPQGRIAATAGTFGVAIAPHVFHELNVQLMAAIPNGNYLEYMEFLDDVWVDPVMPEDGFIRPPERPGHGLTFKPEILKDCRVDL